MSQHDLSVKEATELLGVSRTTIYRMCKRGELPNHYRRDQQIWIPRSDIENYLQRQQQQAAIEPEPPVSGPEAEPPATPQKPEEPGAVEAPPAEEVKPEQAEAAATPEPTPPTTAETPTPAEPEPTPPLSEEVPPIVTPTPEFQVDEPQWMKTFRQKKQIFKKALVNAGIKGANRLANGLKRLKERLERYKNQKFSESSKTQDSVDTSDKE